MPKGLPLRAGERHLAVHVEDHPLDYATFEGVIPAGQYGAGTVEIWDRGTYELLEEKRGGGLTFRLDGERAQGVWTLVPARLDGKEQNWLLLRKDAAAESETSLRPQLATLAEELPTGPGWLYEPKWDGYRAIVTVSGGEATLTSRNGTDLTERFREVARAAARAVRTPSAVLDGEVCALDEGGTARFEALQSGAGRLVLMAFDLLELDDEPIHARPLEERRRLLEELLDPSVEAVRLSPAFDDGEALLAAARSQGLEGVVAKRADGPYRPGRRTPEWRKVKLRDQEDFPIVGYTRGTGRRARLGALVLGRREADGLHWAGNVGSGLTDGEIDRVRGALEPLERATSPLVTTPKMPRIRASDVTWVEPALSAEVDLRREDARGTAAFPGLSRDSRRCARGAPADGVRDHAREAHPQALQPRQAVLARGGDHEGRASRLLPRRRRGSRPSPAQAAVHDEALPGRLAGQELLPEAGAVPHPGLDPDGCVPGVDP